MEEDPDWSALILAAAIFSALFVLVAPCILIAGIVIQSIG